MFRLIGYLPGVPADGSPASEAFWISFWAALYSGAIYSVICGRVVGLIVVAYQRRAERRAVGREYEREYIVAVEALRHALDVGDVVDIGTAREAVPVPAARALRVLERAPLALWREYLGKREGIISEAQNLQRDSLAFERVASSLDGCLSQVIRDLRATTHRAGDQPLRKYVFGRGLGFEGEALIKWVSPKQPTMIKSYEESWDQIRAREDVSIAFDAYIAARTRLLERAAALRASIEESD